MAAVMPAGVGARQGHLGSPLLKPSRGKALTPDSPALSVASTAAPTPISLGAGLAAFPEELDIDFDELETREDDVVGFMDGSEWLVARGKTAPTLTSLFQGLGHVKKLYQLQFGFVDSHNDDDLVKNRDGTSWLVTRGWREAPSVAAIQEGINELKTLFKEVFDDEVENVDDEFVEFADGTKWIVSHGKTPPSLASLEEQLAEVWDLYIDTMLDDADSIMLLFGSYGTRTTTRSQRIKLADGSSWDVLRGRNPPTLESLEERLEHVKHLLEKVEPSNHEAPAAPKLHARLRAAKTDDLPSRSNIFDAVQFGRATRADRKANKKDWMLQRNQVPVLDRSQLCDLDTVMRKVAPTERHYPEPTNGQGRKLRRSSRWQEKLLCQKIMRDYERRNRVNDKQLGADRKRKSLDEFE